LSHSFAKEEHFDIDEHKEFRVFKSPISQSDGILLDFEEIEKFKFSLIENFVGVLKLLGF
jgi:hypothetical protein